MRCDMPIRDVVRGFPNYHFGNCSSPQSPLAKNCVDIWQYEEPIVPPVSMFVGLPIKENRFEHIKYVKFSVTPFMDKKARFIRLVKC